MNNFIQKFKNKYSLMSLPIKAGFWFTICNFMQRGITMITTPVFTRVLSQEDYGMVSTYFSWQTLLLMLSSLSLYKAMMNLYIKYDDKEKVLSAISGLTLLVTTFWFIVYLLFSKQIAGLLQMSRELTFCLFFSFIFQGVIDCWSLYQRYIFNYKKLIVVTIALTLFSSVIGVISVLCLSNSAEGRLIPQVAVIATIGMILYLSIFKQNHTFYNKKMWIFALSFCVSLLPHYLSEFILQSSDKLMINYMCGTRDVAMYSIAYAAGSLINLITNAINSTFAPYQYQQIKAGNYEKLSKVANQVLLFVTIMLAGIMLFSKEIVLIFGGQKYLESTEVIIPICIGIYFNYLFQLFARVQEYYERKITIVVPSILCAVLNLLLNYIFINLYGYQAAAYTTFACYLIFCVIHYFFYKKVCKEELCGQQLYDIKGIVMISFSTIIAGIVISFINQYLVVKYFLILIILILLILYRRKIQNIIKGIRENG